MLNVLLEEFAAFQHRAQYADVDLLDINDVNAGYVAWHLHFRPVSPVEAFRRNSNEVRFNRAPTDVRRPVLIRPNDSLLERDWIRRFVVEELNRVAGDVGVRDWNFPSEENPARRFHELRLNSLRGTNDGLGQL